MLFERLNPSSLCRATFTALTLSLVLNTSVVFADATVDPPTESTTTQVTESAVKNSAKIDAAKIDATKVDATKVDATNVDATNVDATKPAQVKADSTDADAAKPAQVKADAAKSDAEKPEQLKGAATPVTAKTEEAKASATAPKPDGAATPSKELAMIGGEVPTDAQKDQDGPLMIDNDEAAEVQQTIEYKDLPTDEGGTKVKAGATFPVVISSQITSKSANSGDPFEARLKYDLKIKDRLVAEKGSTVIGHVNYVLKARSAMHSLVSPERWYRNSGVIGIAFDEIINTKGEHIPLVATPARQARIIKNKAEGRELGVNHNGQVTGPWSQQLRYKAVRIGLNAAMAPAGVFSFGAMPVALGCIGAANPSFAFMKPVGQNVRHRRIKGFVWGALSGVPGSWIVEDTVVKGQEAVIKPGDEFLAEFKEEFTGEPETEASLIPGASTEVKGQVVPGKKGKKQ